MSCKIAIRIYHKPKLSVSVKPIRKISVDMGSIKIIKGNNPRYDGPYEVIPKAFKATVLKTNNTVMENDLKVLEIPYFETDNGFGNTVYIGSEVDTNG